VHRPRRVKGHRVPVRAILDNADAGATPEQIAGPDIYPALDVDLVRRILAFARAIALNKRLSAVLEQIKAQQAVYPARQQRGHVARQRPPNNLEAPGLPS
jgi:uncharacterized protein (DUF433 family)